MSQKKKREIFFKKHQKEWVFTVIFVMFFYGVIFIADNHINYQSAINGKGGEYDIVLFPHHESLRVPLSNCRLSCQLCLYKDDNDSEAIISFNGRNFRERNFYFQLGETKKFNIGKEDFKESFEITLKYVDPREKYIVLSVKEIA